MVMEKKLMANNQDKKAKIENARNQAVERASGKLRIQFNNQGRCLCLTWTELASKLGLSTADIPAIKALVASRGLQGPKR